ncbi:MAG: hypothetical protein HOO96_04235 [Polyangiaceae bacterium]|nr:hypothetical protein [Polyangiaceae bacterium]
MPIPASNFPGAFGSNPDSVCTLPITTYGPARFVSDGNDGFGARYLLSGTQLGFVASEKALMSEGRDIDGNFAKMPTSAADMPYWYRAVYNPGQVGPNTCYGNGIMGYKHIRAASAELTSDTSSLTDWLNGAGGVAGTTGEGLALDGWRNLARRRNDPLFSGVLATVKTAFRPSSPGAANYKASFGEDRWGMYSVRYEGGHPQFASAFPGITGIVSGSPKYNPSFPGLDWHPGEEPPTEYMSSEVLGAGPQAYYRAPVQFDCDNGSADRLGRCAFWPSEGLPSHQAPSVRARFFANSLPPNSNAAAQQQFAGAIALACTVAGTPIVYSDTSAPPPITSPEELRFVEAWLGAKEKVGAEAVGRLYIEDVPFQVARLYDSPAAGNGALKGQMGVVAIQAMQSTRAAAQSWANVVHATAVAKNEIGGLRSRLAGIEAQGRLNNANQLLRSLERVKGAATGFGAIFSAEKMGGALFSFGAITVANEAETAIELNISAPSETALLDSQRAVALQETSRKLAEFRKQQTDAVADVRDKSSSAQEKFLQLEGMRRALMGNIQKANGVGAWNCPGDPGSQKAFVCRSYVNSVLNARYSGTRIRYENALLAARASAYYARRAVEQRLGVRLDSLTANIGPLEAPSKWAERVCTMHGVDFDALKMEQASDDPAQKRAWEELRGREYANSFIGDYVDLLSNFVEFYNVAYPSQDGNDTLLLSMRENVERQSGQCRETSRNRLRGSEALADAVETDREDGPWQVHLCTAGETKCARARRWSRDTTYDGPSPTAVPGVTSGCRSYPGLKI